MHWPSTPIERLRPGRFTPPHCPWPSCLTHSPSSLRPFRFHRHGHFKRLCDSRLVPRFLCLCCRRTFSLQSFAFSYYLKRPDLSVPIAAGLNAGSAHRQLARSLRCAPSTVTHRTARLGRHCILLLARAVDSLGGIEEPIVYDDFESFVASQDFPFGMGTPTGKASWFIYGLEQAPHRRGGRLTPAQKSRQLSLPPAPRRAYEKAASRVMDFLHEKTREGRRIVLITDQHRDYGRALARHPHSSRFEHRAYRNPKRGAKGSPRSREAVVRDRELFAVDLLHRILRHSNAHHRRETIAFGRRLEALMERGFLTAIWRDFVKPASERRPKEGTPAMRLGLTDRPWRWERVFSGRLFVSKQRLPAGWKVIYERRLGWPKPQQMKPHLLKNAS